MGTPKIQPNTEHNAKKGNGAKFGSLAMEGACELNLHDAKPIRRSSFSIFVTNTIYDSLFSH